MWRMRSWRPWSRRPAVQSTSPFSSPCSERSWRVCKASFRYGCQPFRFFLTFDCWHAWCNFWLSLCPKGADPEDVIVTAFKVLDPEGTGSIKKQLWVYILQHFKYLLNDKQMHSLTFSVIPALRSSWALSATGSPLRRWDITWCCLSDICFFN